MKKALIVGLVSVFFLVGCSSAPPPAVAKGEWIELKNSVKDIRY